MGEKKSSTKQLKTFVRFVIGGIIGFYAVALFSTNAYVAVIVAVTCGVALDKYFARKEDSDE
jgi:hypothetical protein